MGNLGGYQTMTAMAKRVGGPRGLALMTAAAGYAAFRPAEAVLKRAVGALKKGSVPCPTKGLIFRATSAGTDAVGLTIREGDDYRVLECDGDSVLIEVVDGVANPHMTSSVFLATISEYPDPLEKGASGSSL